MGTINKIFNDHREAILYIVFGGFTTLISWSVYAALVWFGVDINVSNILSWVCGVLFAFVVNKWIIFLCRSTETKVVMRELGSFFSARIVTGAIAILLFPLLYGLGMNGSLFGVDGFPARIATSFVEIVLNWIFSKYLVFTKKTVKDIVCDEDDDSQ